MKDQETFRRIYQNKFDKYSKTIQPKPCSCPESSSQDDTILKYLFCVCYTEVVIMGILTMMIMVKMANLEKEEWVWFKIYSRMLFIFSIPFTVVLHKHADVFCALTDQQTRSNDIMEDSTDDDDTEPDKQSKKIKQSSKK